MKNSDSLKIDALDLEIVSLLNENGRMQNKDIASRLKVTEGTIRNRIKKLVSARFLSVKGLINPDLVRDKQVVLLGITMASCNNFDSIAEQIANFKFVKSVYMVTGRFDLMVELFIEPHNLIRFLSDDLGKIKSISTSESFVALKSYRKWI